MHEQIKQAISLIDIYNTKPIDPFSPINNGDLIVYGLKIIPIKSIPVDMIIEVLDENKVQHIIKIDKLYQEQDENIKSQHDFYTFLCQHSRHFLDRPHTAINQQ